MAPLPIQQVTPSDIINTNSAAGQASEYYQSLEGSSLSHTLQIVGACIAVLVVSTTVTIIFVKHVYARRTRKNPKLRPLQFRNSSDFAISEKAGPRSESHANAIEISGWQRFCNAFMLSPTGSTSGHDIPVPSVIAKPDAIQKHLDRIKHKKGSSVPTTEEPFIAITLPSTRGHDIEYLPDKMAPINLRLLNDKGLFEKSGWAGGKAGGRRQEVESTGRRRMSDPGMPTIGEGGAEEADIGGDNLGRTRSATTCGAPVVAKASGALF
ncbi:uncharacterized protein STEHIDRAFT_162992 [Stereum hirsutum FP-91666 SS1]|uniref:Uncharacterized protein n=1 Tax=Stereum hirsutum (strain FP-91666) TaxID=721885 RepID=R7RZ48_STEHR|nr:uncharacterized protein STEHIDRAFT_162992 [Stereum hirsutum FP-91666 SS1]EIM80108.1 hypothetical protein STEHIDRAFT_162992 [Stereum hirsutum FP-91666 SS1]